MNKTCAEIELPLEALQLAARARRFFPGLTDPEIALVLLERGLEVQDGPAPTG